ncbi:MAG: DUF4145 domain-containing protein [Clostridia bacterium]|nr:DUF4145 domain-containing protein [Clostridia bacterium]
MKVEYTVECDYLSPCRVIIDEENECPMCKHSLRPHNVYGIMYKNNLNEDMLCMIYLCTHCYKNFICTYSDCISCYPHTFNTRLSIAPSQFEQKDFDEHINDLSPMFVKIYNQALEAEHYNLDQISGIGYRKALEFLIKDFLKQEKPDETINIEKWALGKCINDLIDNDQLKTVASRATWLGNDQTHYIQKYNDKDIQDLKRLIKLSVNWIEMIYLTKEAENIEKK